MTNGISDIVAYDVCRLFQIITFVAYDVCHIIGFVFYDVCRLIGFVAYGFCRIMAFGTERVCRSIYCILSSTVSDIEIDSISLMPLIRSSLFCLKLLILKNKHERFAL